MFFTSALADVKSPPARSVERADAIDIGSQRELFVDDYLIERLTGKGELRLQHPVPQEIVLEHNAPWEGNATGYHSIFKDGDRYRMYYRAAGFRFRPDGGIDGEHPSKPAGAKGYGYICYAESDDGIHWRKPELGLIDFQGSKANNIVLMSGPLGDVNIDVSSPAVFKDENPNVAPDARYKATVQDNNQARPPWGLLLLKSPDGLHWKPMQTKPILTDGTFDTLNLAYWDAERREYRAYWRYFTTPETDEERSWKPPGYRANRTATSQDMLIWTGQADLTYGESPKQHLYTAGIKAYYRAPHLFVGFPTRYVHRGWSDVMRALPDPQERETRAIKMERRGTSITEALFIASRDGVAFKRWEEAFLRPGIERPRTWTYGSNYIGWHLLETKSLLEGAPNELSLYATEGYWIGNGTTLRRYTLRLDGFVSLQAPMVGGGLISKPLRFQGKRLTLNLATSAAGSVRVEIQDASGKPLPGFTLDDCPALFGDTIDRTVTWTHGSDVSSLANQPVRLRFEIKNGDLFSFQFSD